MQTVTSGKVQSSFGEVADIAKSGDPVTITQYGRPTLMLMRYQDAVDLLRAHAPTRLAALLDERAAQLPPAAQQATPEEISQLIDES